MLFRSVVREAVARSGVAVGDVQQCIMGNVVSAGAGQAPARQAALRGVRCRVLVDAIGSRTWAARIERELQWQVRAPALGEHVTLA